MVVALDFPLSLWHCQGWMEQRSRNSNGVSHPLFLSSSSYPCWITSQMKVLESQTSSWEGTPIPKLILVWGGFS